MRQSQQSAFTLLEIMVALAIIAIAMGAIIENTTASTRNAQYLQEKTIAGWIALNQISLTRAKREWGTVSNKQDRVDMAGREWVWKMKILKTDDVNMRRLEIDVYASDDEEQSLASLIGFMGKL